MTGFYHLLRSIVSLVGAYITKELGGKVDYTDNEKEKGIILRWKKFNPKTKKYLRFNYKITYEEVEAISEPFDFAQKIIEKYQKGEQDGKSKSS